jgi:hypothetical protein
MAGKAAQSATTGHGLLEVWSSLEQATLPLDFAAFNKFHHGGKGAGYRAAQGLREGRRTGRSADVRSKGAHN